MKAEESTWDFRTDRKRFPPHGHGNLHGASGWRISRHPPLPTLIPALARTLRRQERCQGSASLRPQAEGQQERS